jgi:hypothetical protein
MELARRSEFIIHRVSSYRLDDPTSPLAISSAWWSSGGKCRLVSINDPATTSLRLSSFLQSVSQPVLVGAPHECGQNTNTSHELCFPSTLASDEDPLSASHAKTRYGPPSGFDHPLDGLRPSTPGRACFIPTALLGFGPSEPSPLERWWKRFRKPPNPHAVGLTRSPTGQADEPVRHASTSRLWPFQESLAENRGLACLTLDAPLGFAPSRVLPPAACPELPPQAPLSRLPATPAGETEPHLRVSIDD